MAKTNTDLIRELNQEVTTQKGQIDFLLQEIRKLEDQRNQIVAMDRQLTRVTEQVDQLRRRQDEADTRWKWLMATFVGLLVSAVLALLVALVRK